MRSRDADATRSRILRSAVSEFAAHGYAGGRVDRIGAHAETNVRMIYAYFGNKSGLFDAAFVNAISTMAVSVPPNVADLGGWAGEVFDFHEENPDVLRIALWAQLERPSSVSEPLAAYLTKVEEIETRPVPGLRPVDVLVLIYAMAQAWQLAPQGLVGADRSATSASRRGAVVTAVGRLLTN